MQDYLLLEEGPIFVVHSSNIGALFEEGGTVKEQKCVRKRLLGAIFRVCYCFDHATQFSGCWYGGRFMAIQVKWAREKYGFETI